MSSDEGLPTTRLKCFPLYSILLAYSATTLDYLSLDSPDAQDGQVTIDFIENISEISRPTVSRDISFFFPPDSFTAFHGKYRYHSRKSFHGKDTRKSKYFLFTVIVFAAGSGHNPLGND